MQRSLHLHPTGLCSPQPWCQRYSGQLCPAPSPQPTKEGRACALPACKNAWDNAQLTDNGLNAVATRALLGFG